MIFNFECKPKEIKDMCFEFGNIQSPFGANNLYFTKNNKPILPIAGEFHFSRIANEQWETELTKMKYCGITVISTYVFWNHHQRTPDVFDFKGDNDISRFISICQKLELPVILRIGPWCHGEVRYGGFPKFVNNLPKKRCDSPKYLAYVRKWFEALANEVKPFFDGETILGVQLENEYGGNISHIRTLRKIAQEVGFKTPFFTVTAWPENNSHLDFLPMFGGYPEAPWTQNKKPLEPKNRFAISPAKTEAEIGEDLNKIEKGNEDAFKDFPYASCEIGCGNQVTQHRRPVISSNDGYAVAFSRFASGLNFIGYYVFHGGRNPNNALLQESRNTGYPNNYPIIDYDFQAPISRFGEIRKHAERLRLLHLFINTFDTDIATKQAFFSKEKRVGCNDVSMPSCSVRMNDNGGYFFVSSYERGLTFSDYDVGANISYKGKNITLPKINVKAGSMLFYPFDIKLDNVPIDYILAQPVTKRNGVYYFLKIDGVKPLIKANGQELELPLNETVDCDGVKIAVLTEFESFDEYGDEVKHAVTLYRTGRTRLPYGYYLYSHGKRKYYSLRISGEILDKYNDIEVTFNFTGLNLQLFCGKTLIDDYFNTNGKYVIRLREFERYIRSGKELIIKTAPPTKFGIGNVYNEINLMSDENDLTLALVKSIKA